MSSICGDDFHPVTHKNLTICVSGDYYSVDGIRTPVTLPAALEIAAELGMILPTVEMVDDIYRQADVQLQPIPMPPGPNMTSREYYVEHNRLISEHLQDSQKCLLIAGHKKDIVASNRRGRVAIYGWHRSEGNPIQPYSTVHGEYYFDYSHGLRLVSRIAYDQEGRQVILE